jgi:hypothetical protein
MEELIAHYGRPRIWLALLTVSLLILSVAVRIIIAMIRGPEPIDPAEALANGGHIVKGFAHCASDGKPVGHPTYRVVTQSGRPPEQQSGHLSGNMAQVVVGDDWIGQIEFRWSPEDAAETQITDLIGTAFGWHDRVVHFGSC